MKTTQQQTGIDRFVAAAGIIVLVSFSNAIFAGPNCDRKPDHPSCGGGEDPAANPAFVISGPGTTVYLMDADGSNYESIYNRKTARNTYAWQVRWSPDGNRIVYDPRYATDLALYTVNPDGSDRRDFFVEDNGVPILPGPWLEWRTVGTQGATRIFFIADNPNDGNSRYRDVYAMDPTGASVQQAIKLTSGDPNDHVMDFSVSPDGSKMITHRSTVDGSVMGINPELVLFDIGFNNGSLVATEVGPIVANGFNAFDAAHPGRWANAHNWVLVEDADDLFVLDMDAWTITPLLGDPASINPGCIRTPTWSPDDSKIAFDVQCFGNQGQNEGIHTVDFHGPNAGSAPYVDNLIQVTTGLGGINIDWRPIWTP
jgi:hypothetical protein